MYPQIKKRLHRELDEYSPIFSKDYLHVSFVCSKKQISVLLNEHYPFQCPIVISNNKYISYHNNDIPNRLLSEYVQKEGCPCCSSITCPDNWSPALRIIHILREYDLFVDKLKLYNKIRITKHLNLPTDMIHMIISFLDKPTNESIT